MSNAVKQQLDDLTAKFEALNERERIMIFAAVLAVFYALYSYALEPVYKEQTKLRAQIAQDQLQANTFNVELEALRKKEKVESPEAIRIKQIQANLAALDKELNTVSNKLIKPEKMPALLSDLLRKNEKLTLISLNTLPIADLFEGEDHQHSAPIFKHGVEMTIEGRYLALMDYVAKVEKLPWNLNWQSATLSVDDMQKTAYPVSQLTLTVSTISLDKNWLSI